MLNCQSCHDFSFPSGGFPLAQKKITKGEQAFKILLRLHSRRTATTTTASCSSSLPPYRGERGEREKKRKGGNGPDEEGPPLLGSDAEEVFCFRHRRAQVGTFFLSVLGG